MDGARPARAVVASAKEPAVFQVWGGGYGGLPYRRQPWFLPMARSAGESLNQMKELIDAMGFCEALAAFDQINDQISRAGEVSVIAVMPLQHLSAKKLCIPDTISIP